LSLPRAFEVDDVFVAEDRLDLTAEASPVFNLRRKGPVGDFRLLPRVGDQVVRELNGHAHGCILLPADHLPISINHKATYFCRACRRPRSASPPPELAQEPFFCLFCGGISVLSARRDAHLAPLLESCPA